jgi:cytochrome c-type biogenesis protein CcmH
MKVNRSGVNRSSTAFAILLLAAVALAGPAPGIETERAYHSVGDKLICLCGCMQSVYGCNHYGCPQSDNLRKEVRAAIASTNTEDEALAVMVKEYGDKILTEPPKRGFSLSAWVMPFAVFFAGAVLVMLVLQGWKRHSMKVAVVASHRTQVDQDLLDKYAKRIDDEIEKE